MEKVIYISQMDKEEQKIEEVILAFDGWKFVGNCEFGEREKVTISSFNKEEE